MGDAGPAEARPIHDVSGVGIPGDGPELREREVTVLVTGFGVCSTCNRVSVKAAALRGGSARGLETCIKESNKIAG